MKKERKSAFRRTRINKVLKRLIKNRLAVAGIIMLLTVAFCAAFADVIAPYPYEEQNYGAILQKPSFEHLLGTDEYGRDMFSRVIYGSRISLYVGLVSLLSGALTGSILGALAGYAGGGWDNAIMRVLDVVYGIPQIVLAIAVAAAIGPGITSAVIAVGISAVPGFARIARAATLGARAQEYIDACRCIGASKPRIIFCHILPNISAPLIVQAALGVGKSILLCASLSFLGLGAQPPVPEWGCMLSEARTFMRDYPHVVIAPGLAIMLTVLALNLFGDGLRDAIDPNMKGR